MVLYGFKDIYNKYNNVTKTFNTYIKSFYKTLKKDETQEKPVSIQEYYSSSDVMA